MALYTIIRIYEVPAETRRQATDRMLESIVLHTEKDYHKTDYIREPGQKPGQGTRIDLRPTRWLDLLKAQLGLTKK